MPVDAPGLAAHVVARRASRGALQQPCIGDAHRTYSASGSGQTCETAHFVTVAQCPMVTRLPAMWLAAQMASLACCRLRRSALAHRRRRNGIFSSRRLVYICMYIRVIHCVRRTAPNDPAGAVFLPSARQSQHRARRRRLPHAKRSASTDAPDSAANESSTKLVAYGRRATCGQKSQRRMSDDCHESQSYEKHHVTSCRAPRPVPVHKCAVRRSFFASSEIGRRSCASCITQFGETAIADVRPSDAQAVSRVARHCIIGVFIRFVEQRLPLQANTGPPSRFRRGRSPGHVRRNAEEHMYVSTIHARITGLCFVPDQIVTQERCRLAYWMCLSNVELASESRLVWFVWRRRLSAAVPVRVDSGLRQ